MSKMRKVTPALVFEMQYLSRSMSQAKIAEAYGMSPSFVSRVLANPDFFINRVEKKKIDIISSEKRKKSMLTGLACPLCGINNNRPHGHPVACPQCLEHMRLKGRPAKLPAAQNTVLGD